MKLDKASLRIVSVLQREGRISNVELAERVGLSESPCFRRVKQLEESGLIRGYRADLDLRALGLQVTAFVQVSLGEHDDVHQRGFLAAVVAEPRIVECHAMSGGHDFLLKVHAHSMDDFSELSMNHILKYPGVRNIESNFSLQEIKRSQLLPLPG
ncbi:MAG: AsnC family transcriptional regulator [Gammaproteobacteria bacterium]|nr:MAG: AsnC family transcriptional regulator [Gammaproteobacteria bacterium]